MPACQPGEASKIFEALTAEKAVRTPRELGAVVRGERAPPVGALAPEDTPYETYPKVFKAAMTMEGKPGGDTDSGVPFPWLKTTIPPPEMLQAVLQSVDSLADASARRRLVKALPDYPGMDPVSLPFRASTDQSLAVYPSRRVVITMVLCLATHKSAHHGICIPGR